jgi:hypothetical protein
MIISNELYSIVLCDEFQLECSGVSSVGEVETCCSMCKYTT